MVLEIGSRIGQDVCTPDLREGLVEPALITLAGHHYKELPRRLLRNIEYIHPEDEINLNVQALESHRFKGVFNLSNQYLREEWISVSLILPGEEFYVTPGFDGEENVTMLRHLLAGKMVIHTGHKYKDEDVLHKWGDWDFKMTAGGMSHRISTEDEPAFLLTRVMGAGINSRYRFDPAV